jgi:hypothetical protein
MGVTFGTYTIFGERVSAFSTIEMRFCCFEMSEKCKYPISQE